MATSPALDVPPEGPPFKRLKTGSNGVSTASSPAPSHMADLAEQVDAQERQKYIKGRKLGSGQYADVYSAHLVSDPTQLVAIKKIKVGAEAKEFGISYDSLREIKFLQELDHPNIIKLYAVFSTKSQNLNLVLEQLPQGDLLKLIQDTSNITYTPADIKSWMLMLMRATHFCHANYVLHRDIKPNNLLIASDGSIKLADFGLARSFADPFQKMTYNTVTIWYRPPELFFQAQYYGGKVDVWSCGCVFAELVARDVMFRAWPENEINMVKMICDKIGTPTEDNWPGVSKMKGYVTPTEVVPLRPKEHWMAQFRAVGETGVDLLMKMLLLDPRKRLSAEEVLKHPFWTAEPRPSRLEDLPRKGGGMEVMGEDLKRRGGEIPNGGGAGGRGDKVARKIDFGAMK
ncbi:serine/threonine protein kinase, CMGC family, CDC2/CDK subfamily [Neohortaea acidophila]|uniref:Serine/threonine protein kinase, CMGC family, CDC2/CDK subfamily n=1 Tax=Neohortaea acidophila TaxID=245834 RepID=A0A6A6PLR2_9PEZI|nr:serine/threonine protein kinase, CMGC family, CDC2/CDK subfamily [Neohortaea acidophila]KAF2480756.1 serine/threonine protein kinase, CMGC family, CDC2/CDK subfamily [Neohortaea acidophila]